MSAEAPETPPCEHSPTDPHASATAAADELPLKRKHERQSSDEEARDATSAAKKPRVEDPDSRSDSTSIEANQMHPHNIYRTRPPDFLALARAHPEFGPFVTVRGSGADAYGVIDWKDVDSLHALTSVLLLHDFGLLFSMPHNHLCPPVPQRLNYIHWIAELLQLPPPPADLLTVKPSSCIRGVDIGTGASCIFPLLGHATYGWSFVATEVDPESLQSAQLNVNRNHLRDKIEIRTVPDRSLLLDGVLQPGEQFDFSLSNPPFFSSLDQTGLNTSRASAATASELVCPGGEEQFVGNIIRETKREPARIRWCTTMLGRKSSLKSLTALLRSPAIGALVVDTTEFRQGTQTRFGLAWTFDPEERAERERRLRAGQASVPSLPHQPAQYATAAASPASSIAIAPPPVVARQKVLSYTSSLGVECAMVEAGAFQLKVSCFNKAAEAGGSATPLFSCDLLVLQSGPSECTVDLQWRKPFGSAPAVVEASKLDFTRFALALQTECATGKAAR